MKIFLVLVGGSIVTAVIDMLLGITIEPVWARSIHVLQYMGFGALVVKSWENR
jgi:hypothetical protein